MKTFTYLRTLWHEFWMWWYVGTPTLEFVLDNPENARLLSSYLKPEPIVATATIPLEVNAAITKYNSDLGRGMSYPRMGIDFESLRPEWQPTHRIWVYNASRIEHVVDHPVLGQVKIPANTTKKSYALYTSFPITMKLPNQNLDQNVITTAFMSGEAFVKDLISPDNILNETFSSGGRRYPMTTGIGRDLSVKGVFYSLQNPPLRSEVLSAVHLMKKRYSDLLERAAILWEESIISSKRVTEYRKMYKCNVETAISRIKRENAGWISPEHHAAANYFKVTTPWHPVLT